MSTRFPAEPCPLCNEGEWVAQEDGVHTFKHKRREHRVTGMHYALCNHCGTKGYLRGQMAANRDLIKVYQARLGNYFSPRDVLALREKYEISQEQAGTIFQCGKTQFSKWERGEVAPTGTASLALREALENPAFMKKMALRAKVTIDVLTERQSVSDSSVPAADFSWAWAGRLGYGTASNHNYWPTPTSDVTAPTVVEEDVLHAA